MNQRIYNIFIVALLEPIPSANTDPYARLRPDEPPPIFVEGDDEFNKSYIIKRLLNKRVIRKERGLVTRYYIK